MKVYLRFDDTDMCDSPFGSSKLVSGFKVLCLKGSLGI